MKKYSFLLFGALFGFILSRAGATTYDFYARLFLFEDLQLLWVIAMAATLAALGVAVLRLVKARSLFDGKPIAFRGKPYKATLIPGSLLFGLGWGLAGACPGTALAMLGEGKLAALFTLLGILLGTWLYGLRESRAKALPVSAAVATSRTSRLETV
ncbi:MAG: YeeE/YedE family protein [candidate division KSB1 bacterium]|nr:YeeE/YedE family protein [candidate division KSB1 bacterium]MDZ7274578.1 YeeE/YedE family protein [candidate division KSB1 bacterium]MDZ7284761.1 YeeE/YedE family protein [candidate division KSB1 bacterium]MDZ7297819.1 YeeE/YedE family protein [candidate division KSB1 bacterium]MDZ7307783.1 YeeE/YedE family protein [candidate division KSB1 bacterium]